MAMHKAVKSVGVGSRLDLTIFPAYTGVSSRALTQTTTRMTKARRRPLALPPLVYPGPAAFSVRRTEQVQSSKLRVSKGE